MTFLQSATWQIDKSIWRRSKERRTASLCVNIQGDFEFPVIIGNNIKVFVYIQIYDL